MGTQTAVPTLADARPRLHEPLRPAHLRDLQSTGAGRGWNWCGERLSMSKLSSLTRTLNRWKRF